MKPEKRGFRNSQVFTSINSGQGEYKMSFSSLFMIWKTNTDVYGCVREWKDSVGAQGYKYLHPLDPERKVAVDITQRLDRILNGYKTWRLTKNAIVKSLAITGNSFVYLLKNLGKSEIIGLKVLDVRTMHIISDEYGDILAYIQKIGAKVDFYDPSEIVHFKYDQDPDFDTFGFAPMEAALWEIRTDIAAMMSNYYFFENDARPAVQYILEDGMDEAEAKTAVDMIRKSFQGVQNRNKSGVLQGVKEVKTLSVTHQDMQYLEGRKLGTEKVCSAYGTHKFLLGYTDTVNNNNGTELMKKYYEGTIAPLDDGLDEVLTKDLLLKIAAFYGGPDEVERYQEEVILKFPPRVFDEAANLEERGQKEVEKGLITPRQYKMKTNQKITKEDESNPNFDSHIIYSGGSAVLLEDVGVEPIPEEDGTEEPIKEQDKPLAKKILKKLNEFKIEQLSN